MIGMIGLSKCLLQPAAPPLRLQAADFHSSILGFLWRLDDRKRGRPTTRRSTRKHPETLILDALPPPTKSTTQSTSSTKIPQRTAGIPSQIPAIIGIGAPVANKQPHLVPYPKEIVSYLNQHVIGQEHAKQVIAVAVYQHYVRLLHNLDIEETKLIRECLRQTTSSGLAMAGRKRRRSIAQQRSEHPFGASSDFKDEETFEEYLTPREQLIESLSIAHSRLERKPVLNEQLLEKSNVILGGPSGSGKTHLVQKLAEILNVPIALCDCTTLTQAGYVGDDVDVVIQRLLQNAEGDVARAETGIVFLDEIDKIASSSDPVHSAGNRDVSGRGVQTALLKLVEGHVVRVKNPMNPTQKVDVNTANILFIGSGAFAGIEKLVARRTSERSLGFGGTRSSNAAAALSEDEDEATLRERDRLNQLADQGDLIEFGMIPELVGRFPIFVPFHCLDHKRLAEILTKPANNLLSQMQRLFSIEGTEIEFTQCAIDAIVDEALKRKTGARALRSIVERIMLPANFELPGSGIKKIVIDGDVVRGSASLSSQMAAVAQKD